MKTARSLLVVAAVALLSPALLISGARAQVGDQRTTAAQALYDQAVKAMDAKDYAIACPKLEEVVNLVPEGVGAKLTLARCYEDAGRLASAWTAYVVAEAAAAKAGQEARRKRAKDRAGALRPRLATIAVVVPEPARDVPGLEIERDGIPIGPAQWGAAIPVDRGEHVLIIRTGSGPRVEKRVAIDADGAAVSMDVAELIEQATAEAPPAEAKPPAAGAKPAPSAGKPIAPSPGPAKQSAPPPAAASFWGPQRIAGTVAGGLGIAGVAVATIFGVRAAEKKDASDADGHCDSNDRCDAQGLALREEGLSAARISTALFIAGGAAVAGGVTLYATAPSATARQEAKISIGPGGLHLIGTW